MKRTRTYVFNSGGFTLTEMLVAVAVVGLVVGGLGTMITTGQRQYMMGVGQVEAQQNVRIAFDRVLRDIRDAGYNPTQGTNFPAIVNVGGGNALPTSTSFMIQNDWNGNWNGITTNMENIALCMPAGTAPVGAPPTCPVNNTLRGEQVRYTITGNTLTRQESGVDAAPVAVVAGIDTYGVAQPFQYLNQGVNPQAAPVLGSDITTVIVTLQTVDETNAGYSALAGRVLVRMDDNIRLRNK